MTLQIEKASKLQAETALEEFDLERVYTVDEFMELDFPDGTQYELINGKLVERNKGGPAYEHGRIISNLFGALHRYAAEQSLGVVLNNLAFVLTQNSSPIPDLAFIAASRAAVENPRTAYPGPPDLAVEVMSRSDKAFEIDEKIEAYLNAGVRLVWLINPRRKAVEVFRPATGFRAHVLLGQDELDGEDVIPGFKLVVEKLFIL
jgi:Uma2 family endonuclease